MKGTFLELPAKVIEGGSEIAFYIGMDVTGGSLSHSHLNRLVAVPPEHEEYGTEYKTELYEETELDEGNGPDCTPIAGNDPRQELAPLTGQSEYEAPNMKCRRSRRIPRRWCNRMRELYYDVSEGQLRDSSPEGSGLHPLSRGRPAPVIKGSN